MKARQPGRCIRARPLRRAGFRQHLKGFPHVLAPSAQHLAGWRLRWPVPRGGSGPARSGASARRWPASARAMLPSLLPAPLEGRREGETRTMQPRGSHGPCLLGMHNSPGHRQAPARPPRHRVSSGLVGAQIKEGVARWAQGRPQTDGICWGASRAGAWDPSRQGTGRAEGQDGLQGSRGALLVGARVGARIWGRCTRWSCVQERPQRRPR